MEVDFRLCDWFFLPLNPKCTTTSTTLISTTSTTTTNIICQCSEGYEPTLDGRCIKTETTIATPPTNLQVSVAKSSDQYSVYGSILFNPGYNLNGTTSTGYQILHTALWQNIAIADFIKGPLNRCGLWTSIEGTNQDVGFTHCITVNATKTYYIAVGCDNYSIIRIDGTTIVSQDINSLTTQFGAGPSVTFKYWFIYPVELTIGTHVIEMVGHNISSIATLGAEIYDATPEEIISATDYTTFYNDHILFTTKDMIGQDIQIGTDGYGYTCPNGYSLITCDGPPYCINTKYLECGESPPS